MENERKPYGSFTEFMKQEGYAAMYEQDRQRIQAAETELEKFMEKFKKYADSEDLVVKNYYEIGVKWRQKDVDFMKKFLTDFKKNG